MLDMSSHSIMQNQPQDCYNGRRRASGSHDCMWGLHVFLVPCALHSGRLLPWAWDGYDVRLCPPAGRRHVRINLSEQSDMMDLLGADLPVAGGLPGQFAWCDGPLLAALRAGDWVLLDELNLAGALLGPRCRAGGCMHAANAGSDDSSLNAGAPSCVRPARAQSMHVSK